jgi:polar amino acid transport system ATP-binding protein
MIEVHGLGKSFDGHAVLNNFHLEVEQGATGVLIGPSGAGKSMLLRCLGGLESFDRGRIAINSSQVEGGNNRQHAPDLQALRLETGFVFQQFNLFPHRTALENIIEGPVQVLKRPAGEAEALARTLLDRVRLGNHANRYPHQLSGGEQQRVAIARALAMQPRCLLMDEPTSALDPEMVGEVLAVIREIAEGGMTLLIATHEMEFARDVADRVWMLDRGEVVESGSPQEVLEQPREERTRLFLSRLLNR